MLFETIGRLSEQGDVAVGIGTAEEDDAAARSVTLADEAGMGPIRTFEDAAGLVDALVSGDVGAAVRGTLSSHDVIPTLLERLGAISAKRTVVMDRGDGSAFMLAPVGIDEGRDLEERWALLRDAAELARFLGVEPRVAIMAMGRPEDIDRGESISLSVRECQGLRSAAEARGLRATCVGIQLERALVEGDLVIAPDGVTGNLIFRSLHYLGGHPSWGAVALGVFPFVFVDTSRGRGDYLGPIRLARALAGLEGLTGIHGE